MKFSSLRYRILFCLLVGVITVFLSIYVGGVAIFLAVVGLLLYTVIFDPMKKYPDIS